MKQELEITRHNVTPSQFLSYVRAQMKKKGFESIEVPELKYWKAGNDLNFGMVEHYGVREKSVSKPYEMQTFIAGKDYIYNLICEFEFDDEKTGTGYFYYNNSDLERTEEPEPTETEPEQETEATAEQEPEVKKFTDMYYVMYVCAEEEARERAYRHWKEVYEQCDKSEVERIRQAQEMLASIAIAEYDIKHGRVKAWES